MQGSCLWPRFNELRQNKRERDTVEIRYPAQLVKNNVVIEDAFPVMSQTHCLVEMHPLTISLSIHGIIA